MGWLVSALAGYVLGHALDVVVPATGQWLFSGPTQGVGPCTYGGCSIGTPNGDYL